MCLLFVHMGHHTAIKGTLNNGVKIQTVEPGMWGSPQSGARDTGVICHHTPVANHSTHRSPDPARQSKGFAWQHFLSSRLCH